MTQDEVVNELEKEYQIVTIINLVAFDTLPTGRLYTAVKQARKESFNNRERIVIIAPTGLAKTFADQPHDILIPLQKYIQHHDISHYFIVVVTNIKDLADELEHIHKKYNPREEHSLECRFYQ